MEEKHVIAAFLDLTEFRSWTYRANVPQYVKAQFLQNFYDVLQDYVKGSLECWSKYEGDALLTAKEISSNKQGKKEITEFVGTMRHLIYKVRWAMKNSKEPPPDVRIRIMDGPVWKIMVLDPNDPERKRKIAEYIGYCLNTLKGLLGVNPENTAMATWGVIKIMGKTGSIFRCRKLEKPSCYPKGVNREDIDGLHILKF